MQIDHPKEIIIDGVKYAPVEEPLKLSDCKGKDDFIKRLIDKSPRRDSIKHDYDDKDLDAIKFAIMEAENLANFAKLRGINLTIEGNHDGRAYVGVSWQYLYPEINMLRNFDNEWQELCK